jgi:hypothetical protein
MEMAHEGSAQVRRGWNSYLRVTRISMQLATERTPVRTPPTPYAPKAKRLFRINR